MNTVEFNKLVEERCEKIKQVLAKKAGEYTRKDDRHHNFRQGASMFGTTPEQYLMALNGKHLVSIMDMINDINQEPNKKYSEVAAEAARAMMDEKIGDAINYFILLEGLMKERIALNTVSPLKGEWLQFANCSYPAKCPTAAACRGLNRCQRPIGQVNP